MVFAHLPAGFITTYLTKKLWCKKLTKKEIWWTFFIGTLAGVLPDIDTLYYYLIDSSLSHREFITHTPILYVAIFCLLFLIGHFKKSSFVKAISLVVLSSALGHLVLDSLTSGIGWLYPVTNLIYGFLSIPVLAQGFYGQHLFVFTLSLELTVYLIVINVIVWTKIGKKFLRTAILLISIMLVVSCSAALFNLSERMFTRDAGIYYGDLDRDGLANKNDLDIDGDNLANIIDEDANNNGQSNLDEVVNLARTMEGVYYDQTNKKYWSMLARFGFLSNADVVLKSYEAAGIFLSREMEQNYHQQSQSYRYSPADSDFNNSVYNIYVFCQNSGRLVFPGREVIIGDIIFYGDDQVEHLALVVEVDQEQSAWVIDAGIDPNQVVKIESDQVSNQFGKVIAYGRIIR